MTNWIAWLFGVPAEALAQGEIVFDGIVSPGTALILGALACGFVILTGLFGHNASRLAVARRGSVLALQCAFIGGVLALLAGPALEVASLRPGENAVAVLIDTSRSMALPEADGASRLEAAQALLDDTLRPALSDVARVVVFGFDAGLRSGTALDATGAETRLLEAVQIAPDAFAAEALAAVVVLSDGADTTGTTGHIESPVPVHTVGIGPTEMPGEVRIGRVALPSSVTAESLVTAGVTLHHSAAGSPARVEIREGDRLLAVKALDLDAARPTETVELSFGAGKAGLHDLSVGVVAESDSLAGNNRVMRLLTVQDRRHRVLYVEGAPRWEYKYLRRALARDDVLELVSWLRTTERKTYRQGTGNTEQLANGVPQSADAQFDFDVVVLGSVSATHFSPEQHRWLESFVAERGGSLLALAGRESLADGGWDVQPLARALPVVIDRETSPTYKSLGEAIWTVTPTTAGRRASLVRFLDAEGSDVWDSLPPLADFQSVVGLKPAATVLLELADGATARPLLVMQPYGLGTAAVLATATTWRWQMRTPPDDPRHELFWRHLIRQLAEDARPGLSLRVEEEQPGRLAVRIALPPGADPEDARATLVTEGGTPRSFALETGASDGVLQGSVDVPPDGVHRVDVRTGPDASSAPVMTRFARTGGTPVELRSPVRDDGLLERLAEATGGRHWDARDIAALVEDIRYGGAGVRTVETIPLWSAPVLLLFLLALKGLEWAIRRGGGRI